MHINIHKEDQHLDSLVWFPQTIPNALQKIQITMSKLIVTQGTRNDS